MIGAAAKAEHGAIVRAAAHAATDVVVAGVGDGIFRKDRGMAVAERMTALLAVSIAISNTIDALVARHKLDAYAVQKMREAANGMAAIASEQDYAALLTGGAS